MTKTEEIDDPFSAHLKRDPLPGAGIRIILLADLPAEHAHSVITPLSERIAELERPVEERIISVGDCGLAEGLRRGLEDASLPLVLVTTATAPWTADHLEPLLKAIDENDHVLGCRPRAARSGATSWLERLCTRLVFAMPLDDVHSPCRLHRREKLLEIPLQSRSSFLDTEILAKATFLGHLINEVKVPALPSEGWDAGWWADWNQVFKHPEFKVPSCPAEIAKGDEEGDDRPGCEDQERVPDLEDPGSSQNDRPQGLHELGERQRTDDGLEPVRKPAGGEEHAGEQPHRQHDQVHEAADGLGRGGAAADEKPDAGERESAQHIDGDDEPQVAADRHFEHQGPEQEQHGQVGQDEGQPRAESASRKSRRGMGVATIRFNSLPIRKFTTKKPIPQSPPPIALSPMRPGIRKSMYREPGSVT